ncbi:transcription antitermination protein [Haloarcula sp. CBA1130]|uniref:transcription antitermination protein n=1 Tax=unclassified Haloarcula TaxID=2624677 RepID=UPI0012454008|nr:MULTISPECIES: transcription antitermination protein [unclassified Haloarcula]KAA9399925.1 transcription antitermination protein [Haloarcula sp. CBA1129]KAA9401620.1 transcription antitermination protein [Haloarcula sp. CBA1130]
MDAGATIDAVRDQTGTERDRLGSDKVLIAATDATLETKAVLTAAVTRESGLADIFGRWAAETDSDVTMQFEAAAEAAAERSARIDADAGDPDGFLGHLETVSGTAQRVGAGLIAAPLVADRFYLQVVSFFINEADERRADTFREIRQEASALDGGETALEHLSESERETAAAAAAEAIEAAYDDYAETLEAMGLDPKPVC